jgi:PPOX class probable F420-dependent enzyme
MAGLDLVRSLADESQNLGVLSVVRPDGSIHSSLVKAGVFGDPWQNDAVVGLVVAGGARKLEYLRRSGRANVVFTAGWQWVSVEGPVRLAGPDDPPAEHPDRVPAGLRAVFVGAGGTHDDWEEFDRTMASERRCAVLVVPQRIISN